MTRYELLKHLEWSGPSVPGYYDTKLYPTCLVCDQSCEFGHSTNCELDAALKRKTVEVEIPPVNDIGHCNTSCPLFQSCKFSVEGHPGFYWPSRYWVVPGPGCPWYGESE